MLTEGELAAKVQERVQEELNELFNCDGIAHSRKCAIANLVLKVIETTVREAVLMTKDCYGEAVGDGYTLVPIEPTREMLDAAKTDLERDGEIDPMLKGIYRAMLGAAQKGGAE